MCGGILEGLSAISTVLGLTKKEDTAATTSTDISPTSLNLTSGTATTDAIEQQRKKNALAQGYSSTIATGGSGVTSSATTQKKTLLGS